jgi:hypothetical protein
VDEPSAFHDEHDGTMSTMLSSAGIHRDHPPAREASADRRSLGEGGRVIVTIVLGPLARADARHMVALER